MNTHRYIARIILEADTTLFVGSGESSLLKDAIVQKDFNGLPMIPGTALMGVLRHAFLDTIDFNIYDDNKFHLATLFGNQFYNSEEVKEKTAFEKYYETKLPNEDVPKGYGSRLRISSAYMMINETTIAEGTDLSIGDNLKAKFDNLPSRQHVRIDHKGGAQSGGLFDNEVVYKGVRFKFELELIGNKEDEDIWKEIIIKLQSPLFRLGQGTRNGYGKLKVHAIKTKIFDLTISDDFNWYSDFDASLNKDTNLNSLTPNTDTNTSLLRYTLKITPDSDFFIFSEGYGDDQVDNKPLEEEVVLYKNETIYFETKTVIPASSIKGALAHRTAFHYNKLKKRFSDELFPILGKDNAVKLYTGPGNKAVNELFGLGAGFEWGSGINEKVKNIPPPEYDEFGDARRGKVIIDDMYYSKDQVENDKIFNHVAIDRFTGGAMDGALFSEKVSRLKEGIIELNIYLDKTFTEDDLTLQAFENALLDITKGLLPLGGMTTKGHGIFTGSLSKNGKLLFDYNNKTEHEIVN